MHGTQSKILDGTARVSRLSSLASLSLLSGQETSTHTHPFQKGRFVAVKGTQDIKPNVYAKQLTVPVDADLRHGSSWLRQPESKREEGERVSVLPATRKSTIAISGVSMPQTQHRWSGDRESIVVPSVGPLATSLLCLSGPVSPCTVVHAEVMMLDARRLWTVTGLSLVVGTKVNPRSESVATLVTSYLVVNSP